MVMEIEIEERVDPPTSSEEEVDEVDFDEKVFEGLTSTTDED